MGTGFQKNFVLKISHCCGQLFGMWVSARVYVYLFWHVGNFRLGVKLSRKYGDFLHTPPPTHAQLPHDRHPTSEWYVCCNGSTCIDASSSPKAHSSLGGVQSMGFDRCVMKGLHHYSVLQNNSTAPKILWVPSIQPPFLLNSWRSLILLLSPQFCLFQNII